MDRLPAGRVLLVGEGDFSFSVAYDTHVSPDVQVTSSSLLTQQELAELHKDGPANVLHLKDQGVNVLLSVDATKLEQDERLVQKFDRIIFNFPHSGGKSNIKKNRELVRNFFASAVQVLCDGGDICVTFCRGQGGTPKDRPTRAWHDSWQAVAAAAYQNLVLRQMWPFDAATYPGYSSTGFRSLDKNFYTGGGLTYVFQLGIPIRVPPKPCPLRIGTVSVGGQQYSICSSYVAQKFNRKLHERPGHPVQNTYRHLLEGHAAASSFPYTRLPPQSPVVMVTGGDASRPLAFSATSSENTDPSEDVDVAAGSDRSAASDPGSFVMLRRTLLDHLSDEIFVSALEVGTVCSLVGEVCRVRPHIDSNDLPVQHELLILLKTSPEIHKKSFDDIKSSVSTALSALIGEDNTLLVTQEFDDQQDWFKPHLNDTDLHSIEATYKSHSQPSTEACNQVHETGSPKILTQTAKFGKVSRHLGYFGTSSPGGATCIVALLNLDALAMTKYDIPDSRLLWSEDEAFCGQFASVAIAEDIRYEPVSLYPPLWRHDISLWESSSESAPEPFEEQRFLDVVREVAGDSLKRVLLMNLWEEPSTGRVSRCYRLVYQSYDRAVSHSMAHDIQNSVRLTLTDHMDIELR